MSDTTRGTAGRLQLGALQGLAAWSSYAVLEFLASSVLNRVARPYARFASWHWELTGWLMVAYMAVGLVCGGAAALLVFLFRRTAPFGSRPAALLVEHAAALSLVIALAGHIVLQPAAPDVWWKLLLVPLAMLAMLLLALTSEAWSTRLGLATNPWVLSGLFLATGQISALQFMGTARQLGAAMKPFLFLLIGGQAVMIVLSIWPGRRWRQAAGRERIFVLNWAGPVLAMLLAVLGFLWGARPESAPPPAIAASSSRPNVILIVMDAVRADHLSVYGYDRETTPNLKRLAADATLYPQALAPADSSLSSHASMFTGLYPSWHGGYCQPPEAPFGHAIGPVPTLAETLLRNGYRTVGAGGNLFLRADFGLQRGFQQFRIPRPVPILAAESWYLLRNGMRNLISLATSASEFDRLYARGDAITAEFFEMLSQPELGQAPFFAFLNYMDAHAPYVPPPPFDHRFPGKNLGATQADLVAIERSARDPRNPLPAIYPLHAESQYDGAIAYMDSQIGLIVDWLQRQGLYDNTMILVTGDHGESFGERRLFEHGNSLYANLLRVGLLVKYPHRVHTGVVSTPVSLVDIFPTVLSAAQLEASPKAQGKDLLDPSASEPRPLFSESFPCPATPAADCPSGCLLRSVVSWPDKFIWSSSGRLETYQLQQDPNEIHNLFGKIDPTSQTLAADLRAWIKTMPLHQQYATLSPENIQRLKALGDLP